MSQTVIKTDDWEVLTDDGWQEFDGVVITHAMPTIKIVVGDDSLECTRNHKVLIDGVWIEAKDLPHENASDSVDVYDLLNVSNGNKYVTDGIISHNCLYVDELAFVNKNIAEEFWTAVYPVVSTGGKIIVTSTPNGDSNRFYYLWRDSHELHENDFADVRIYWEEHPERDSKWGAKTRKDLGDDAKWMQEYECSFLSNSKSLIELNVLNVLLNDVGTMLSKPAALSHEDWNVYEYTKQDAEYFIFCDCGEGIGADNHVINIFNERLQQVAVLANNTMDFEALAQVIYDASEYYNEASIYIEAESSGHAVAVLLQRIHDVPERLMREKPGKPPGLKMTAPRRNRGITVTRQNVKNGRVTLRDRDTINEFRFFKKPPGSNKFQAEFGCKDDRVMTCVLMSSCLDKMAINNDNIYDAIYSKREDAIEDAEIIEEEPPAMISSHQQSAGSSDFDWV